MANFEIAKRIARAAQHLEGRAFIVGGFVRDQIMNRIANDIDMEVHGLTVPQLRLILDQIATDLRGSVDTVGASFGVHILTVNKETIEIALPRRDSKGTGGHTGIAVTVDPFMGVDAAVRRRDFRMNSVMLDPLTGQVIDPANGIADILLRRIEVVDEERFLDDPLRVLRALRFQAQFGFTIQSRTEQIIRNAPLDPTSGMHALSADRIGREVRKILLAPQHTMLAIDTALRTGLFNFLFPAVAALAGTPQDAFHHPEGDALTHSLMTLASVRTVTTDWGNDDSRLVILLAALYHDVGKLTTTTIAMGGRIRSLGHAEVGAEIAAADLARFDLPNHITEAVVALVREHMNAHNIAEDSKGVSGVRRLANRIGPATMRQMARLIEADLLGTGKPDRTERASAESRRLLLLAEQLHAVDSKPQDAIRGQDLLNLGLRPGPLFRDLIARGNQLRDDEGMSHEQILDKIMEEQFVAQGSGGNDGE